MAVLTACGNDLRQRAMVQVGDVSIGNSIVNHWAKAIALPGGAGGVLASGEGSPRQRAVRFLIAAQWLIGEARDRGFNVSQKTFKRHVRNGQTTDDAELEAEAELAGRDLRSLVARTAGHPTSSEVADYYTRHAAQFRTRPLRVVDLIEEPTSRDEAIKLGRRLGPGERFARKALREEVAPEAPAEAPHEVNHELVHAIFAAPLGKVAGPAKYIGHWVLIVVRRVIPGRLVPRAKAEGEIATRLSGERLRRAEREFLEAYRHKWIAKTSCRPGFVVWGCSQYRGASIGQTNPLAVR